MECTLPLGSCLLHASEAGQNVAIVFEDDRVILDVVECLSQFGLRVPQTPLAEVAGLLERAGLLADRTGS